METLSVAALVVALLALVLTVIALRRTQRPRGGSVRGTVASSVLPAFSLLVIAV